MFRRGRWWCADLRPWDGGRPTLRNPSARGWPDRGNRTEDEETARRWAWAYVDLYRDGRKARDLGLRTRSRPIGPLREEWIAWRERQRRAPKTIEGGITATGHLMDFVGRDFPVEDVEGRLQALFDGFLEAGYATSTLDTMRRHLSAFFAFAKLEPNPIRVVRLPQRAESPARAWTPEELVAIRAAADKLELRLAIELALGTGARQAELWALERGDFSETRRTVHIRRQLDRDATTRERLKGTRSRTAVVLPALWPHLPERGGLLLEEDGAAVKLRRSRDLLLEVLEDAGVAASGIGWHSFRHTYARLFLGAGGRMLELQRSLGHASMQTTERIYGHWSHEDAASEAVGRIYAGDRRLRIV